MPTPTQRVDAIDVRADARETLGDGSVRVRARLTRTGVFTYYEPDGTIVRELRHPDEVFAADSLESLPDVSVVVGHPDMVRADNWKAHAAGHVGAVAREDSDGAEYVAGKLTIKDASTIGRLGTELVELSCGYTRDYDPTPGEYRGERYDGVQRNIRYNHVGLGPVGWGRAGAHVRVLDGGAYASGMPTSGTRTDDTADARVATLNTELAAANARADKAEAERDALKKDVEKARADSAPEAVEAIVRSRLATLDAARAALGPDADLSGDDRSVKAKVIAKHDPDAKLDGKSDDYVTARFEVACSALRTNAASLTTLRESTTPTTDGADGKSPLDAARERMIARNANAWKLPAEKK